jgi:alpha-ribazole phosphatase/probable phosphoglycerate mutase
VRILLVRHGEIPANTERVYAGKSPEGLTARGIKQAEEVAEKLKDYAISAIYSSPVNRAIQTAEMIGRKLGMDVRINAAFREMELGPWEGLSEDEVARRYPEEWELWKTRPAEMTLPNRETLNELLERVLRGIRMIRAADGNSTTVIVTHVAIIRVLMLWNSGRSLNLYKTIGVPNAGIFQLVMDR